ncbi:MAG: NAD-dependent epimerase/dehydratase family protein [Planctomycetaceae bacterium]
MEFQSLLITGGAGFVGSNLAVLFRERFPDVRVTVLDNLKRRGSEWNLPRLREAGVSFLHGDVRCEEDFEPVPDFDLLIDCAAEPSVHAGSQGSPRFVLNTNLSGTTNCLELARQRGAAFLFLSTSRVYPIRALNELRFEETDTRFRWTTRDSPPGISEHGVAESFPLQGARSFYGASKLAGELLVQEYGESCGMKTLVNRCGILTGPWQMGKVDQGVVALWIARHHFKRPLTYLGFGGRGKQVRDLLHVRDLFDLIVLQMNSSDAWTGCVYNVGGGPDVSVSLRELTMLCEEVTGNRVPIDGDPQTNPLDVRIYETDSRRAQADFQWRPQRSVESTVADIHDWVRRNESRLQSLPA